MSRIFVGVLLGVLVVSTAFGEGLIVPKNLPATAELPDGTKINIPYPDEDWSPYLTFYLVWRDGELKIFGLDKPYEPLPSDVIIDRWDITVPQSDKSSSKLNGFAFFYGENPRGQNPSACVWRWRDEKDPEKMHKYLVLFLKDGVAKAVYDPDQNYVDIIREDGKVVGVKYSLKKDGGVIVEVVYPR